MTKKYTQISTQKTLLSTALICITAFLLTNCTTTSKTAKNVHYECDRGSQLNVTFTEKGVTTIRGGRNSMPRYEIKNVAANVTLPDGSVIILPVQKVASGFMYSNGKYSLRGEGNEAMWAVGRMLAERCEAKP